MLRRRCSTVHDYPLFEKELAIVEVAAPQAAGQLAAARRIRRVRAWTCEGRYQDARLDCGTASPRHRHRRRRCGLLKHSPRSSTRTIAGLCARPLPAWPQDAGCRHLAGGHPGALLRTRLTGFTGFLRPMALAGRTGVLNARNASACSTPPCRRLKALCVAAAANGGFGPFVRTSAAEPGIHARRAEAKPSDVVERRRCESTLIAAAGTEAPRKTAATLSAWRKRGNARLTDFRDLNADDAREVEALMRRFVAG
jgi:hypothetical protein